MMYSQNRNCILCGSDIPDRDVGMFLFITSSMNSVITITIQVIWTQGECEIVGVKLVSGIFC